MDTSVPKLTPANSSATGRWQSAAGSYLFTVSRFRTRRARAARRARLASAARTGAASSAVAARTMLSWASYQSPSSISSSRRCQEARPTPMNDTSVPPGYTSIER
ncbi:hypothetical protein FAF44_44600 [Nonomuraea sp. MG754425]|uniref:hypothetical protein n=1 Tax=Nonomuraea sp. MG754425 TaxID=2570319 RepID=UPI002A0441C8|nr:hypothetical protein [Nonomuraea sp. MG754425]